MLKQSSLICSVLLSSPLWGSESESPNSVDLFFDAFRDANEVVSLAPGTEWTHKWSPTVTSTWTGEMDAVTGATRLLGKFDGISGATAGGGQTEPKEGLDAITGATSFEVRKSTSTNLAWSNHGNTLSGGFYYSKENDYESYSPSLGGSWDFFERNFTLGLSHAEFFDRFSPQEPFKSMDEGGRKRLSNSTISLAQSLTPTLLISGNAGYTMSWGYLGHPYNPVTSVDGSLFPENVPDYKSSSALSSTLIQSYFWGDLMGAAQFDYRYYTDSWGLRGQTAEISLTQYLTETLTTRFRFRYYHQGAVDFAKDAYFGNELYRTADVRFHAFNSYLVGIKFAGHFPETWKGLFPQRWEFKVDQLYRDTKGNRRLYQLYSPSNWYNQTEVFGLIGYDF